MKCKKGYEIKCLKSAAGYYIGTLDNDGFPNCRISGYFKEEVEPKVFRMTRMDAMENQFCHGYSSCINTDTFKQASDAEDKEWGTPEERGLK